MAGVKDLREAVAEAATRAAISSGERTVLFVDEIHRFNKAQQDALLPHVEAGTVMLIGATTENPSFEVNAALLSRAKVVVLQRARARPICALVIDRALADAERGLGEQALDVRRRVRDLHRARGARRRPARAGDAGGRRGGGGARRRTGDDAIDRARRRGGAAEAGRCSTTRPATSTTTSSARSSRAMRGTDPDAAVYWMARMLEAGEDPLFVLRRMVIFAAEDVGIADPRALLVAIAALDAFRFVGLPEGLLPMTQAAHLPGDRAQDATPRSPPTPAAKADVDAHGRAAGAAAPAQRADAADKSLGCGAGYQYPHDFEGHYVARSTCPRRSAGAATTSRPTRATSARSPRARPACASAATAKKTTATRSRTEAMPSYVAMLRGINVSGSKPVKMDALRVSFEALGFKNVRTYVQSGNVVFEAKERAAAPLAPKIVAADQT